MWWVKCFTFKSPVHKTRPSSGFEQSLSLSGVLLSMDPPSIVGTVCHLVSLITVHHWTRLSGSQRVDLVVLTFHWLPDGKRINCKIALIVCKSQHFVMLLILLSRPSPLYGDDYSSTSVIQNYKMIPCRCLLLLLLLFQRSAVSFWKYSFRLFIHFFCWRPLLLIPSTWQWSALASNLSSSILDTMCPNHIAFCSTLHRPAV